MSEEPTPSPTRSSDCSTQPEAAAVVASTVADVSSSETENVTVTLDVACLKGVRKVVRVDQGPIVRYDLYVPLDMREAVASTLHACLQRRQETRHVAVHLDRAVRALPHTQPATHVVHKVPPPPLSSESEWPRLTAISPTSTTHQDEDGEQLPTCTTTTTTTSTYSQVVQNTPRRTIVRDGALGRRNTGPGTMDDALYAISWNTNSVWNKRTELDTLAGVHWAAILALQETRLRASDWQLRLPGFLVVSEPATFRDAGKGSDRIHARGGLSIAIAKRLTQSVSLVGRQSPHTLFVRVWLHGGKSLVIGNVYVPPLEAGNRQRQLTAIRVIKENIQDLLQRFPTSAFVILGDWNMKASKVNEIMAETERMVKDMEEESNSMLRVQAPEGSEDEPTLAYTYHHSGKAVSSLDHCIIGGGTGVSYDTIDRLRELACCRVDRLHCASDHWPLVTRLQLKPLRTEAASRSKDNTARGNGANVHSSNGTRFEQYLEKALGDEAVEEWHQVPRYRKGKRITANAIRKYTKTVDAAIKSWSADTMEDVLQRVTQCAPNERDQVLKEATTEWNERRLPRKATFTTVQCSNYWAGLADRATRAEQEDDFESLDDLARECIDVAYRVAGETGMTSNFAATLTDGESDSIGSKKERRLVSRRVVRLSIKKRTAFERWSKAQTPESWESYRATCKTVRKQVRSERTRSWSNFILRGMRQLTLHKDASSYWAWIRAISAMDFARGRVSMTGVSSSNVVQPIVDPESGEIEQDPHLIERAWHSHFSTLTSDTTGHSRDERYWEEVYNDTTPLHRYDEELPGINGDIDWMEARVALESFQNNKAPGVDGIPNGFIKLLLKSSLRSEPLNRRYRNASKTVEELERLIRKALIVEDTEFASMASPSTSMAESLFAILKLMWKSGRVPSAWQTSWMVQVPKKGDATIMDNYRGISLMDFMVKWLTKIVINRISRALERTGRMCREQAGFRTYQESVGQAATLVEIIQRRQLEDKETYVAFLDFSKAYDMVPHMALFAKMEAIGVRGKALELVKNLYETTKFVVRTPMSHPLGAAIPHRMDAVHQRKGLRQGCPMSPTLFNIFINDLFDVHKRRKVGPSCSMRPIADFGHDENVAQVLRAKEKVRIPGLLFADDTVVLARSRAELQQSLAICTQWAERNEMRFNATKCGAMGFSGKARRSTKYALKKLKRHRDRLILQGQQVPVVESYVYLGVELNYELDHKTMAKHRLAQAVKASNTMSAFFRNQCIPTIVRATVLKSVVVPMAMYGAEIWGMKKTISDPTQTEINRILRLIAGRSSNSNACVLGVGVELNVPPVRAMAAARRARAFTKWHLGMSRLNQATWINVLCSTQSADKRRKTWVSGTLDWLKKRMNTVMRLILDQREERDVPSIIHRTTMQAYKDTLRNTRVTIGGLNKSKAWEHFQAASYHPLNKDHMSMSNWIRVGAIWPSISKGLGLLMQFRSSIALLAPGLVRSGQLDERYRNDRCPCCNMAGLKEGETRAHVLLECEAWTEIRNRWLEDLIQDTFPHIRATVNSARHRQGLRIRSINSNLVVILLLGGAIGEEGRRLKRWAVKPSTSDKEHDEEIGEEPEQSTLPVDSYTEEEQSARTAFWRSRTWQHQEKGVGAVDDEEEEEEPLLADDYDVDEDEDDTEAAPTDRALEELLRRDVKEIPGALRVSMFLQEVWPARGILVAKAVTAHKEANAPAAADMDTSDSET